MKKQLLAIGSSLVLAGALFTAQDVNASEWQERSVETIQADLNEDQTSETPYIVQYGDTLSNIAQAAGISVESLVGFNAIQDANLIFPGQEIYFHYNAEGQVDEVVIQEQSYEVSNQGGQSQTYYSQPAQSSQTVSYSQSGSEAAAKEWIAQRESGGRYDAYNPAGGYYGRYQLNPSLIHRGASPAEQEAAADAYVAGRYGSWTNAQAFWQRNGWY